MTKEEAKQILDNDGDVEFRDFFLNEPIKIYYYDREYIKFTYDFGDGEEKFLAWEMLVSKIV